MVILQLDVQIELNLYDPNLLRQRSVEEAEGEEVEEEAEEEICVEVTEAECNMRTNYCQKLLLFNYKVL